MEENKNTQDVVKQDISEKTQNESSMGRSKDDKAEKLKKIISIIIMCLIPLGVLYGCTIGDCIKCTSCGDDNNRLVFYASGTDENGVKYRSCVGPGAILGIGLNCKFWPTECVSVKQADGANTSGCVTYYNALGCIDRTEVMSEGKYDDAVKCGFVSCAGTKYIETVGKSTKASESTTCLGFKCGESTSVIPNYYNSSMPRAFTHGCWTKE